MKCSNCLSEIKLTGTHPAQSMSSLSKRELFAILAMQALIPTYVEQVNELENSASAAVQYADALIAELNKEKERAHRSQDTTRHKLQRLQDSEINFGLNCFYDVGFEARIGDKRNGFSDKLEAYGFDEIVEEIWRAAKNRYPDATVFKGEKE